MSLQLVIKNELTPTNFAEIGRPYRIFRNKKRTILAVCSHVAGPMHPSKWYHGSGVLEHRVSVYQIPGMVRLGILSCPYPVNHVEFHKTDPVLLASIGSYDGGYNFQGSLLRFDWEQQNRHEMLGESREVVVARYQDDGRISLLIRPRHGEEFADHAGEEHSDHHQIFVGLTIDDLPFSGSSETNEGWAPDPRLVGLPLCDPADFGFSADQSAPPHFARTNPDANDLRELFSAGYESRAGVWDMRPLDDERFAVLMSGCLLEVWHKRNGREACFNGVGDGLECLHQVGEELLLHVLVRGEPHTAELDVSQLWKYSKGRVTLWKAFDGHYSWCVNGDGWLLGKEGWRGHLERRSLRISPRGDIFAGPEGCGADRLGGVQLLPRGASELHFVRQTGGPRTFDYRLWTLKPTGEEREIGPLGAAGFSDAVNAAIPWDSNHYVRVCERWDIAAHKNVGTLMELVESEARSTVFSIPLSGKVTQMLRLSDSEMVLAGHRNGGLSVVDLGRRKVILEQKLLLDGLMCVPSALSEVGGTIIVGTDDGRLLEINLLE